MIKVCDVQKDTSKGREQMFFNLKHGKILAVCGSIIAISTPAFADCGGDVECWGAIAGYVESDSDGCSVGSTAAWNYSTKWEAGNAAMSLCWQESGHCSDAVQWRGEGQCGSFASAAWNDSEGYARCAYGSGYGSYSGSQSAALRSCELGAGGVGCEVTRTICLGLGN